MKENVIEEGEIKEEEFTKIKERRFCMKESYKDYL